MKPAQWAKLESDWAKFVDTQFTTVSKKVGPAKKAVVDGKMTLLNTILLNFNLKTINWRADDAKWGFLRASSRPISLQSLNDKKKKFSNVYRFSSGGSGYRFFKM